MKRGMVCGDNQQELPNILEQYQLYLLQMKHLSCLAGRGNAVSVRGLYKFALSIGVIASSCLSPYCNNAFAGSVSWMGSVDSSWHTDGNWVWDGHTPTGSDNAQIDAGPTAVISSSPGAVANLFVGTVNAGALSIENDLTSTTATLGNNSGSSGNVAISSSRNWSNSGYLYIGNAGTGLLTLAGDSSASADTAYLGTAAGGDGTVTLNGNSDFSTTHYLFVGYGGSGTLTIASGQATSEIGVLGDGTGSDGTATITGSDSSWINSGTLTIGGGGQGTIDITDGGRVSNTIGVIGNAYNGLTSAVTVAGTDSLWTNTGQLFVGSYGTAELHIEDAGEVTSVGAVIGRHSVSSATVTGAGSTWSSGFLAVGGDQADAGGTSGNGTLNILNQGQVNSAGASLGDAVGATGAVTIQGTGSTWQSTDRIGVGKHGNGTLTIANGAQVQSTGGLVGWLATGSGEVSITGAGSSWINTGHFFVGNEGDGVLAISSGGFLTNVDGYVGTEANADGTATITGLGSSWVNTGDFLVAHNTGSTGTVTISDGATVSDVQGLLGDLVGSNGTLTVTGPGSLWSSSSDVNVGRFGTGTLTIADGGRTEGNRGYIGNEVGSSGSALVTGAGSVWYTVGKFVVGLDGSGTLTVANGGKISTGEIDIAYSAGSSGVLTIGAAADQTATVAGILDTDQIHFGSGNGQLIFNFTDSYTLGALIDGSGEISLYSGNLYLTGASEEFTGNTNIFNGVLSVNGTLGGNVFVSYGGELKGSGTVGYISIGSGGVLAPGNSIGVMTAGDVTFASGSTYEVEVDADGNSDKIVSTGAVTINSGSAISILPENGTDDGSTYDPYTTYTLITADDGVFGTFGAVSDAFAFLDVNLSYDVNNVYLALLRNNMDFTSIAETQNQIAVAGVVEAQGTAGALYRAVLPLTEDGARDAFDQLSGEVYASTQSMLLDDSRFVREAILSHIHVMPTITSNSRDAAVDQNEKYAVWGAPFRAWGDWDGDGNAASLDRSIGGVVAGCDVMLGSSWTTGFAFGYSKTDFDVDSRLSSGSADGYHLGTYALKQLGGLDLTAGAAYSWHQVDTDRTVQFSGFRDDLKADYDADASQFFGEASYNFTTQTGRISPFLNLAYVHLSTDSFTEQGGEAALQVDSSSQDMVYSTLGLRAEKQIAVGGVLLKPNGSLGWRHGFGDNVPTGDVAFESGNAFAVEGVSIARNAIVGEFGLAHDLTENASINVAYNGQFSSDLNDQGVKATFVVKF